MRGPILVLSLFDGVGTVFAALIMLGACFHALAWETNQDAVEVCRKSFRPIHHCGDVLQFHPSQIEPFVTSRQYSAVLVIGGSPCQDVSLLKKNRPGAQSDRTQLFTAVPHVAQTCRDLLAQHNMQIPVLQVLENVHHASRDFLHQASVAMHGPPITISAGSFGWTRRDRSWWCSDGRHSAHDLHQIQLPAQLQADKSQEGWSIRWQHKKPWPAYVPFSDGFKPLFDPSNVAKSADQQECFPVFTRAFPHAPDRGPRDDPSVLARFNADGGRFPLFNYVESALLWKHGKSRPPNSAERAAMLKWAPKGRAGDTSQHAEDTRCSLVGNSFHVPSCMVALMVVFQLCPQVVAIPPAAYVGLELHLRSQAVGTVWQPDLLASFPWLLTWEQLEPQARSCFGGLSVDLPTLASPPGLDAALARLQIYWVDTQLRGLESTNQGPQWRQQKQIADSKRALGQQAGGPNTKNAALPLIPLGLGKQAHICLATCLPSPFDTSACLDDDASFACRGMCVLGPCIRTWRQLQLRALRKLVHFLPFGKPGSETLCIQTSGPSHMPGVLRR